MFVYCYCMVDCLTFIAGAHKVKYQSVLHSAYRLDIKYDTSYMHMYPNLTGYMCMICQFVYTLA